MTPLALIALSAVVLFVLWRMLEIVFAQLDAYFAACREQYECLCRKGAVNPVCPLHGWEKAETEGSAKLTIGAESSVSR